MSNTTFTNLLASESRDWVVFVQIEAVGPNGLSTQDVTDAGDDGRYRFCSSLPAIATDGTQPASLWLDYLTQTPDILSEVADELGGTAEYGSASVSVLDNTDLLTSLLRTEARPFAALSSGIITAVGFGIGDTAQINVRDVIFIDGEAMLVGEKTSNSVGVTRGYLDTKILPHDAGAGVFPYIPFLRGRRMEIYVMPAAAPWSERQLVGRYGLNSVAFEESLNAWVFRGRSQIQAIDGSVPFSPRTAKVVEVGNAEQAQPTLELQTLPNAQSSFENFQIWTGSQETSDRLYYLQNGNEVVSVGRDNGGRVQYARRALAGTEREPPELERVVKQVFVADPSASSFRFSPGPTPSESRSSGTWNQSDHWVDICLCILTSSAHEDDLLELVNYDGTYGNWSCLAPGYGLGVPHAEIDFASWLAAKQRTDEFRFPNFSFGSEARTFGELAEKEFLRPIGAFMVVADGKLRMVLPSNPLAFETVQTPINTTHLLTRRNGPDAALPELAVRRDLASATSELRYRVGVQEVDVGSPVVRAGQEPSTQFLDVVSADSESGPTWAARAQARVARRKTPATELEGLFDASLWTLQVGDTAQVTLPELPEFGTGGRGWTAVPCQVLQREIIPDVGGRGVHINMRLKAYSPQRVAFRVSPAAEVSSVSVNTATVVANRFTSSDAEGGLPTTDASAFTVGDVVTLIREDGTEFPGVQTITNISGNDITLNGNFSGSLAAGEILTYPQHDDATSRQQAEYAYMGNLDDGRLDTSDSDPKFYADI